MNIRLRKKKDSDKGRLVLFIGPDGSGKTTLIKLLVESTPDKYTMLYMGNPDERHARTIGIKVQGYIWRNWVNKTGSSSPLGLLSRVICHLFRIYNLWIQIITCLSRNTNLTILLDRYAYDYFLRNTHTRFYALQKIIYYYCFPKPDLTISLVGNPEVISRRKAELSAEEVAETINRQRQFLKKHKLNFIEIDSSDNSVSSCVAAIREFIET